MRVRWQADYEQTGLVNVRFSKDNGRTWTLLNTDQGISPTDPRWGNMAVPLTAAMVGTECLVKISGQNDETTLYAVTPRPFTVTN
jgi:hypothetical protein